MREVKTVHEQSARGGSPWAVRERWRMVLWEAAWFWLCEWTPKPLNGWRLAVLRFFGAQVAGNPFVHQRARILKPWNLEIRDGACVGDRANLYTLDRITIGAESLIAQEAYLCTGDHGSFEAGFPLTTAPVEVCAGAFVGARAFVLPGVRIGEKAVVGACAVVARDVAAGQRVKGNPAR